jgi:hypothetical protein
MLYHELRADELNAQSGSRGSRREPRDPLRISRRAFPINVLPTAEFWLRQPAPPCERLYTENVHIQLVFLGAVWPGY